MTTALIGTWHIQTMELWDADYFNMEVQAYILIQPHHQGEFQFGLVSGHLDGYMENVGDRDRFMFTWEGSDEMDEASGSGWVELAGTDHITGMIALHLGDRSEFQATRATS